jgi:hypothetical protein
VHRKASLGLGEGVLIAASVATGIDERHPRTWSQCTNHYRERGTVHARRNHEVDVAPLGEPRQGLTLERPRSGTGCPGEGRRVRGRASPADGRHYSPGQGTSPIRSRSLRLPRRHVLPGAAPLPVQPPRRPCGGTDPARRRASGCESGTIRAGAPLPIDGSRE